MKLRYEIKPPELRALRAQDGGEVLFAVPYDIEDGRTIDGILAVTETGLYCLADGAVRAAVPPILRLCRRSVPQKRV